MSNENAWRFGVSGNIVNSHTDQEGVLRYGTKAFAGGTKVYLNGKLWRADRNEMKVIGRNRFGRFVVEHIPIED